LKKNHRERSGHFTGVQLMWSVGRRGENNAITSARVPSNAAFASLPSYLNVSTKYMPFSLHPPSPKLTKAGDFSYIIINSCVLVLPRFIAIVSLLFDVRVSVYFPLSLLRPFRTNYSHSDT
jgi:hypothetical protein